MPPRSTHQKIHGFYHDAAGREGTRYARHLPYRERNSQSRQLIEMRFFITTRHAASLRSSRDGIS